MYMDVNRMEVNVDEIKDAVREAYYSLYNCINEDDIDAICRYIIGIKEEN